MYSPNPNSLSARPHGQTASQIRQEAIDVERPSYGATLLARQEAADALEAAWQASHDPILCGQCGDVLFMTEAQRGQVCAYCEHEANRH